ncbi:magnesium transporter [Saccharospirillum salsuginis]|uniref:Magnesium transporter MgtE n=1 Tax=Saccharospirillum salsuginis TaxID=418750 RepID=A0A918KCD0_9GAMM|nr:magnesium transporter [Saccharospirillum salsuginis]GGX56973.1 magnesium transporter MgtE [Saccharospirillum salsuginis]
MTNTPLHSSKEPSAPATVLTQSYLRDYPREAARALESMPPDEAYALLATQSPPIGNRVWIELTPSMASHLLSRATDEVAVPWLRALDTGLCAALLKRFDPEQRSRLLALLTPDLSAELSDLMAYPSDSAGAMMETRVITLNSDSTVETALAQLKHFPATSRRRLYVVDSGQRLEGQVGLEALVVAAPEQTMRDIGTDTPVFVSPLDTKDEVADLLEKHRLDAIPVVDIHQRLLGVIRGPNAIDTLREDISADIQTMVGVSRDEQALSSSLFAVRKRQPWLQINLLTGFLAAAVVGLFESTIAQVTALAVLMPVAAGQSGNTGAQALAVTMRGLTLREITLRHWTRVMLKEAAAGCLNGLAVAITAALGVYVWSRNLILALVLALSLIISMTIAGMAGALVPIVLKRLGQDPAQSSSIILTTITDIAGFLSFLGIATLMLVVFSDAMT